MWACGGPLATTAAMEEDAPDQNRMNFWEHIDELRQRLKVVIVVVILLWVSFMTFTIRPMALGSAQIPMLQPPSRRTRLLSRTSSSSRSCTT